MRVAWLYARLTLAIALLFGLIYGLLVLVAYVMGYGQPIFIGLMAIAIVVLQYIISPKIVELSMRVKYIKSEDNPKLYAIVQRLATDAHMPMPRVGISELGIPNAFAFGRSKQDGRVCVTRGLLSILNDEELEGVIGHELSHIRHRDMIVLTMLSVIPMIAYFIFWSFLWQRRRSEATLVAIAAFGLYFISNLLVLYVNRIREYYADIGSFELTGKPQALASALYRITIATSSINPEKMKQAEGMKAFFATDPSKAKQDIIDFRQADLNMDGHIDEHEMKMFAARAKTTYSDKILELFSSHPHVVARIKRLAEMP